MEAVFTWTYFLEYCLVAVLLYMALLSISKLLVVMATTTRNKQRIRTISSKVLTLFKPLAIVIAVLVFVGVNFLIHGALILLVLVFTYSYIRSFLSGTMLKINPLMESGVELITGNFRGEVIKLLPFGLVLETAEGKRYVNYTDIEKLGFAIRNRERESTTETLYFENSIKPQQILDLMFETPLINYNLKPTMRFLSDLQLHQVHFKLEQGVRIEELISYFEKHNISAFDSINN